MTKPSNNLSNAIRIVFVILLGFLSLASWLFLIFFVPVVAWYIWGLSDKNRDLERRIVALENPAEKDTTKQA